MKQLTLTLDDATFASAESQARKAGKPLTTIVVAWLTNFSSGAEPGFERLGGVEEKASVQAPPRSWIDAFSGDADDESLEHASPLERRKPLPLLIDKLPTANRLAELYDEATADYDLPLTPRSEDVSRPVLFP